MVGLHIRESVTYNILLEMHYSKDMAMTGSTIGIIQSIHHLNNQSNFIVIHLHCRVHFVDPNDPTIHTQSIEATWKACKQSMKHLQGTTQENMPTYLYNYMFRRSLGHEQIFQNMLYWIRQYNGF